MTDSWAPSPDCHSEILNWSPRIYRLSQVILMLPGYRTHFEQSIFFNFFERSHIFRESCCRKYTGTHIHKPGHSLGGKLITQAYLWMSPRAIRSLAPGHSWLIVWYSARYNSIGVSTIFCLLNTFYQLSSNDFL